MLGEEPWSAVLCNIWADGSTKVQEFKWRKLQNTKTTTAQRTNRVKNERLKHKLLLIRRTLDLLICTQKLISFCCCPPDDVFWPDVCFCWGRAGVPYSKLRSSSSGSITAPEEHLLRCIVDLQVLTLQYTQRKNVLLTIVFYLHMNFFGGDDWILTFFVPI